MKKIIAILLALSVLFALTACSKTEKADENEAAPEIGMPNPMREVSADELELYVNVPEGAADVRYFIIEDGENRLEQVSYTLEGKDYCYRMQQTGDVVAYDMSGIYANGWETEDAAVSYCDAVVMNSSEGSVIYWMDVVPGINYTLSSTQQLSADELSEAAAALFVPMQGDAAGDEDTPVLTESHYEDADFDTVDVEYVGMNVYKITIGLYRLSTFEGEGHWEEESLKFTVEAPDGSSIDGRFYPCEDADSFALCFTESKWSLLESGTVLEGFLPTEPAIGMPNPMTEVSSDELEFDVNLPEGAADVRYFILKGGENKLEQVSYTLDGKDFWYRMQRTGELASYDMSGIYTDEWETEAAAVSYCDAVVLISSEGSVIYWLDVVPGVNYTLSCAQQLSAAELSEAAAALFVPMQGES
ncbi:MAG: hypothetical protein KBS46_06125 [Clostridiales bacterium]|nr:hypothetical protein [Candidatus Apopatocola equi]